MKRKKLYRALQLLAAGFFLTLLVTPLAQATTVDPTTIQYSCISPTSCTSGSTTLVTNSLSPTYEIANTNGNTGVTAGNDATFYAVALIPNGSSSLGFSFSGNGTNYAASFAGDFSSGSILGGSPLAATPSGTANPNFSAFQSASAQAGVTASDFAVYVASFLLTGVPSSGPYTYLSNGDISGNLPAGTVLYAALADCGGTSSSASCGSLTDSSTTVTNSTPLSESLTVDAPGTATPEPTSMLLMGIGLFGLGWCVRRQRFFMEA